MSHLDQILTQVSKFSGAAKFGGLIATFTGYGRSKSNPAPSQTAFINELRGAGFGVQSFSLLKTDTLQPIYSFKLSINDSAYSPTQTNLNNVAISLKQYFNRYFDSLAFGVSDTNVGAATNFNPTASLFSQGATANSYDSVSGGTYTVKSGDTFSKIAGKYSMTTAQLKTLNPQVANINVISVGQILRVSGTATNEGAGTWILPTKTTATASVTPTANTNTTVPPVNPPKEKNWFDRTFFDGAGALTGLGIGVLCVLGVVVVSSRQQ